MDPGRLTVGVSCNEKRIKYMAQYDTESSISEVDNNKNGREHPLE